MEFLYNLMLQDLINSDAFFGIEDKYTLEEVGIERGEVL